ncbi:hypothetical protein [Pareuzebyella sediminis]|uniref:hypothetical protein n=1 Tax=Pareuzebyella sediminis TaxID=2607998 RepID=UPI0011EC70D7|nr:hypothetical protein [Pareuzebyella sediminis]
MEAIEPRLQYSPEDEKGALLIRLERTQEDLEQLQAKLRSYRYEPKTYSLFERFDKLRRALEALSHANREIISAIREHRRTIDDYAERALKQIHDFHRLHKGVEEYRSHCAAH